jgi:Na+-translocating ferredoxin:NAD+ oxidoreductase subunit C
VLKTFKPGGIHPSENKITAGSAIRRLPVTGQVSIPLKQHIGVLPRILVERGDMVKAGQLIAKGEGFISASIHSSVSGKVIKIDNMIDVSGYKRTSIVIKVEGDEWLEDIDLNTNIGKVIKLDREEIIRKVNEMGIVGLGGATFPSHVKLMLPRGRKAEYLLVNGAECEPYLTSDHSLMMEKGCEILIGIKTMMRALEVNRAIIGIEINKSDAISHLADMAEGFRGIRVQPLKVKYPQGGEKQLVRSLTGREVPSGGLPIDIGAVVFNVATMFAVYEAIQKNKPLVERVVTVSGNHLKDPGNFLVRIGTPISALLDAAGGVPEGTGKIISGGPMMGKALNSLDVPVTKGTSGLLVLPESESRRKEVQNCIRCSKCISVCPMGLEPYLLMALGERELFSRMEEEMTMDCIECGSCSYICPANRPLLDYIRLGKTGISKLRSNRNK